MDKYVVFFRKKIASQKWNFGNADSCATADLKITMLGFLNGQCKPNKIRPYSMKSLEYYF